MDHPDQIAQRFQQLRGLKNFREIAVQAGVTNGQWHNWEKGKNVPTLKSVRRIAPRFGVDPEWILEGRGKGPKLPQSGLVAETPEKYGPRITYHDIPIFTEGVPGGPGRIIEVIEQDLINADDWAKVPDFKLKPGHKYMMFRVIGDSMEPLIKKRDLILVNLSRQNPTELLGKPVLAWLGARDGATVKILEEDEDKKHWILRPTKPGYRERIINKKRDQFQVAAIEAAWLNFE